MKLTLKESADSRITLNYDGEYSQYVDKRWRIDLDNFLTVINKLKTLIDSNKQIFDYTDNKVHDVAYEIGMDAEYVDSWLEDSWDMFKEYLDRNDLNVIPVRGSGSKFVIRTDRDDDFVELLDGVRQGDITIEDILSALYQRFVNGYDDTAWYCLTSDEKFNEFLALEYTANYEDKFGDDEALEWDVQEILSDSELNYAKPLDVKEVIDEVRCIIDAYQYVEDFKENQVQNYNDYVSNMEEF